MEYCDNKLCISHQELTCGIITETYLKQLRHRHQIEQVRRGCNGTPALFAVESLPVKYRTEVYRRYPDFRESAESKPFVDCIVPDVSVQSELEEMDLPNGEKLSAVKILEITNNCSIMNAFGDLIMKSDSHRARQGKPRLKQGEFWRRAAAALPRIGAIYPNSLPTNARSLQRKYQEYSRDGWSCFISKKYQNVNSASVDTDEKRSLLKELLAHHNNLDNVSIAGYYNSTARLKGWKEIKSGAVGYWRKKFDLVTSIGRLGETKFRNTKTMQFKRSRPSAPFLMWTLDGWVAELLYQDTKEDSRGRTRTYTNRLCLEVVLDPCCDYPIGYAISYHENGELIKAALRNAAEHSKELFGEMLRPVQIQSDNFLKGNEELKNVYLSMCEKYTPAKPKNAKSKVIEPYFGYLNKKYGKKWNNWSGFGITTNPDRQPNSEALNKIRKSFPDKAGTVRQIEAIIEWERKEKRAQFVAMMEKLKPEYRVQLSRESFLLNFGADTGYTNTLEGSGLKPTLLGMKRTYDCFDINFRKYSHVKWTVKYDPNDLHEVLAVSEDGSKRFMLTEKYIQPMALADRKPGDAEEMAKVHAFNKQLEESIARERAKDWENIEPLFADSPQLEILNRLLIVDSRGQHKLAKARARLGKIEDADAVEMPILPQGGHESDKDDYSIF